MTVMSTITIHYQNVYYALYEKDTSQTNKQFDDVMYEDGHQSAYKEPHIDTFDEVWNVGLVCKEL